MTAIRLGWCSPAEFWAMPPGQFWWLMEAHTSKKPGGDDMEAAYQLLMQDT